MPGDDDTFWMDCAYDDEAIDDAGYDRLFEAVAATADECDRFG